MYMYYCYIELNNLQSTSLRSTVKCSAVYSQVFCGLQSSVLQSADHLIKLQLSQEHF